MGRGYYKNIAGSWLVSCGFLVLDEYQSKLGEHLCHLPQYSTLSIPPSFVDIFVNVDDLHNPKKQLKL